MDGRTRRITAAVRKEFRQFARDPVILFLVLWLYTAEVVICALALTFDLRDEPVAVLDRDRTRESRELVADLDRGSSFAVRHRLAGDDEAKAVLDDGRARVVVVIPRGFGRDVVGGTGPEVQLLLDGTNSMVAMMALGVARRQIGEFGRRAEAPRRPDVLAASAAVPVLENRMRLWYNSGLRFTYFVVISMIALAAYMVGVIHPAAAIVREKESGTVEQLSVTPLGTGEIMLAKSLPTLVVGLLALGPGLLIARLFGVPFRGDPLTFAVLSAAFLVSAIGTGVVIASVTRTLQQALLVSVFILFPILFLSGTMTPIESMPELLQTLSRLSPLRYYNEALLAVFLKGVGLRILWPELVWMLGLGAVLYAGSYAVFRRRLV